MRSFDLMQKKDDEEKKDTVQHSKSGMAVALEASVKQSAAQAKAKYARPDYNPETRKAYYDDSSAHKKAMDDAFAGGETVTDPYTGAKLLKRQQDAKAIYGDAWQKHAGESDHIDPLAQFVKRSKKNPFLTTDDVREIGNSEDNFQILSRKLNQTSKEVGKGGSTQQEWADDAKRMEGLAENIESGESVDAVRKKIKEAGKAAEKRNDTRAFKRGVKNAAETAHNSGMAGAQNAGVTALTMSGIMNCVAVIKGEKSGKEAVADTMKDGGKAAVTGYATGGGLTVLSQCMSNSSSEFVKALANSNVPGKVITAVIVTGDTLVKWGEGEITTQECLIQLGEKGVNMATMGYSMAVGQALIPIPIVGGAVGALVGSLLTSALYNDLVNDLKTKKLEHEERLRIIAECEEASKKAKAFRKELEEYLDTYFKEYRSCFDAAMSSMQLAYEMGDADGVIAGANDITRKLGGQVKYETVSEFKAFLDNGEDDML